MSGQATPFIDPTAVVEAGATIGAGTRVWHYVHIRRGAHIGSGGNIGNNVFVDEDVVIGNNVKIQNNVSVYRGVTLEDDVFIGPSAVFTNDHNPRATSPDWTVSTTLVRHGASVGANATIVCGCVIGHWAMVGAGAVVTRDVEPYRLVYGSPARPQGWVCKCGAVISHGERRPDGELCSDCGRSFGTEV